MALLLLPGLLLRSLIPVGFMPMFGPGFSVGLMLCPVYAPIPDVARSGSFVGGRAPAAADASMAMSGMDIAMDMPMSDATDQAPVAQSPSGGRAPAPGSPGSGNGREHQYDSLYHYLANAIAAAVPTWHDPILDEPPATTLALAAPQVSHFALSPRAQSARAPPPQI
ncbi:MAG: hypothetical protein ACREFP_04800 [Acetobacteraceae bacterium]